MPSERLRSEEVAVKLDSLTEGQLQSVTRIDGPLLISAGAGSGKTFTLTQRIAYALLSEESEVRDIEEVLAITFTEKAAGEIKARVKSTLRQEGLPEQALRVDASWISTIHAMCSRILRQHALEIGLDPGFAVISDAEKNELVAQAIDEALGQNNEIVVPKKYARLCSEYPLQSNSFNTSSVTSLLEALLNTASSLRRGLAEIQLGPTPSSAGVLARELLLGFENVLPLLEQTASSASADKARADADVAIRALQQFLIQDAQNNSLEIFAAILEDIPFLPRNFGRAPVKEAVGLLQALHQRIANDVLLGLALPITDELMALATEVYAGYERKKSERFVLDNDDLLLKTLRVFEEYPAIAHKYAQKFKLVMVDEFQDTSQIQIDIIEKLAGRHFAHLCTVGDAQQSIYRFRGADVNVYEAHKELMQTPEIGAKCVVLDKNFRSHRDVLSFVDAIFEQDQVFGKKFMSLMPDERRSSRYLSSLPRIDVMLTTRPSARNSGVQSCDALVVEARGIAKRFAALRECGHSPGDMVVLLGKMTNAEVYAQALRDANFECVIAGGSLFGKAAEVRVIARLAEVLANQTNSAALFEVLSSDIFGLSADDFIELSTLFDEDTQAPRRRALHKGFRCLSLKDAQDTNTLPLRLRHAVRVMNKAWNTAGAKPLSCVVKQVLLDSGWLSRTEKQGAFGIARAGNAYKAIRYLQEIEQKHAKGPAQTAKEFSAHIKAGLKEAPGALTGAEQSVVKIMTIHASKGLEFPFVAIAEFSGSGASSQKLLLEQCEGATFASLALQASLELYPSLAAVSKKAILVSDESTPQPTILEAKTLAEYRYALKEFSEKEEAAESYRKFYVGLTRASEALVVALSAKVSSKDPLSSYRGIIDVVRSALCKNEDFPTQEAWLDYGGSEPAHFERVSVSPQYLDSNEDDTAAISECLFAIPAYGEQEKLSYRSYKPLREGVFSYSALTNTQEGDKPHRDNSDQDLEVGESGLTLSDFDKATDLGTVFHRLAQFSIETGMVPSPEQVQLFARRQNLSPSHIARLEPASNRWFSSSLYAQVSTFSYKKAELPFFLPVGNAWMEGEIDLFYTDEKQQEAFVVDYKTGGKPEETDEAVYQKHLLQAQCYAYAVLSQGYLQVKLYFVRVEQEDSTHANQPQTVVYSFSQQDRENLRRAISILYNSSLECHAG